MSRERDARESRFASAFAETGISDGDLYQFSAYDPPAARGSIWFEGFGSIIGADTDDLGALVDLGLLLGNPDWSAEYRLRF